MSRAAGRAASATIDGNATAARLMPGFSIGNASASVEASVSTGTDSSTRAQRREPRAASARAPHVPASSSAPVAGSRNGSSATVLIHARSPFQ